MKLFPLICIPLLIGCATKTPPPTTKDAAPEAAIIVSETKEYANSEFKLSVPVNWSEITKHQDDVQYMAGNIDSKSLLMVIKEPYNRTYDEYIIANIRSVKQNGVKVANVSELTSNGTKFALIKAYQDDITVLMWITVKDGFGWGFSCGGLVGDASMSECEAMFNSFVLK